MEVELTQRIDLNRDVFLPIGLGLLVVTCWQEFQWAKQTGFFNLRQQRKACGWLSFCAVRYIDVYMFIREGLALTGGVGKKEEERKEKTRENK